MYCIPQSSEFRSDHVTLSRSEKLRKGKCPCVDFSSWSSVSAFKPSSRSRLTGTPTLLHHYEGFRAPIIPLAGPQVALRQSCCIVGQRGGSEASPLPANPIKSLQAADMWGHLDLLVNPRTNPSSAVWEASPPLLLLLFLPTPFFRSHSPHVPLHLFLPSVLLLLNSCSSLSLF